jgi:hypothetical protein
MKRFIFLLGMPVLLAGCATTFEMDPTAPVDPHPATAAYPPNSVYADPTYPGPGVHFGAGLGRWGGQRGAGVGFGVGF